LEILLSFPQNVLEEKQNLVEISNLTKIGSWGNLPKKERYTPHPNEVMLRSLKGKISKWLDVKGVEELVILLVYMKRIPRKPNSLIIQKDKKCLSPQILM